MLAGTNIKEEYFPPHPDPFYFNHIQNNLYTSSECDPLMQVPNQYINTITHPLYYNQQFPVINHPYQLSPDSSEDEQRTNFILTSAENESQIIHNYPTPSTSPNLAVENTIKDLIKNDRSECTSFSHISISKCPKKLSDEMLYDLDKLKRSRELHEYRQIRHHVNYNSNIESWMGESINSNLPLEVLDQLDLMVKEGFKNKNELIDLMNRKVPKDYAYNPNKSHIVLDYDKITLMVIRLLNNVASRRSRYRKKFANHIKLHCLKIDMDENFLLYKQQCYLQDMVRKMENKMLNVVMDYNTMLTMRSRCGLV